MNGTEVQAAAKGERLRWVRTTVILIVLLHFGVLLIFFEPAICTPDAHGYFAQARLLAEQGTSFLQPESPVQYRGPHWYHVGDNNYATTFPPGLPVLLAAVYRLAGPTAALLVNPLLTSLTLLGLFFLCREWVGETWGLVSVLIMAANPFVNEHALFGDSHAALDFFFIWSLVFLTIWIRTNSGRWAFCTGLCSGMIPTIRYPELVLCLPIVFWVLFVVQRRRISWQSVLWASLGAALPLGALLLRNQALFGGFWKTGYAFLNEPSLFGWDYFRAHWLPYISRLALEGSGLTFVLGVAGIVFLLVRPETRAYGALLAAFTVPLTVVYMAYFFPPDPQSMRYLLPTLFVYAIAAVWLLKCLVPNRRPWNVTIPVLVIMVSLMWGLPRSVFAISHLKKCNRVLSQIAHLIETHVEEDSVLAAGEAVSQHLDFLGRWRLVDGKRLEIPTGSATAPAGAGPRQSPAVPPPESGAPPTGLTDSPGTEGLHGVAREIWHWAEPRHRVYVLGDAEQLARLRARIKATEELVAVAQLRLPDWRESHSAPDGRASKSQTPGPEPPPGPMGPDRIFDLVLKGQDLVLAEWRSASPAKADN